VRIGLGVVRGVGTETAQRIVAERDRGGLYTAIDELTRRVRLTLPQVEALATAGALTPLEPSRRGALWSAGAAARERPDALPGTTMLTPPPALPGMTPWELMAADLRFTGLSPDGHPVQLLRAHLDTLDVLPAAALGGVEHGTRVQVGGAITHIQRPPTAAGVTFLNLEDETGMINIIISPGLWATCRPTVRGSTAVIVRGVVESASGAINLLADRVTSLTAHGSPPGRRWE
jgi:error-prone DNA polymerase